MHAHELGRHVAASVAQTEGRSVWMPLDMSDELANVPVDHC